MLRGVHCGGRYTNPTKFKPVRTKIAKIKATEKGLSLIMTAKVLSAK